MSALSIQVPFPVFQGRDGQPLENGYVWIGEPNLNPQTNPVVAYYDRTLTIVAAQPLRTLNGYISRAGTPAQIYVSGANFSILVQDSKGSMVYNFPDGSGISADTVSIKDFGAVGDGITNDTVAIQNALDVVGVTGGELLINNGTYMVTTLTIPSDITLVGESVNSVIKRIPTGASLDFIVVDGVNNVTFSGVSFDTSSDGGSDGNGAVCIVLQTTTAAVDNITIENCTFNNGVIRPYIDVRTSIVSYNLTIVNNRFFGQSGGIPNPDPLPQNTQAIRLLATANFYTITVDNNYFRYISSAMQMRPSPSAAVFDRYFNISWSNNVVTDTVYDPNNFGMTPIEIFGATNVVVDGNKIDRSGRGLCAVYVKNAVYNNNVVREQHRYFMEFGASDGVTISNNTALNCHTFVNVTGSPIGTNNVTIVGNVIKGGNIGIVEKPASGPTSIITVFPTATNGHDNWIISNNIFDNNIYTNQIAAVPGAGGSIIRIDEINSSNWVISNNQFIATDELVGVSCINVANGSNVKVLNNSILRTANISTITYETLTSVVGFINVSPGATKSDITVAGNTIKFTGTDTRPGGSGALAIGASAGPGPLPGGKFIDNVIIGAYGFPLIFPYTSLDVVVKGNNLDQATGTNSINSAIVYIDLSRRFSLAAAPTTGSWTIGDVVMNKNPAIGQPIGWMCTVTGTPGTWVAMANL